MKFDLWTVFVDWNRSFRYTTTTNGDNGLTWTSVQPSQDSCDLPQMLTARVGDYMSFTFTVSQLQGDRSGIPPHPTSPWLTTREWSHESRGCLCLIHLIPFIVFYAKQHAFMPHSRVQGSGSSAHWASKQVSSTSL